MRAETRLTIEETDVSWSAVRKKLFPWILGLACSSGGVLVGVWIGWNTNPASLDSDVPEVNRAKHASQEERRKLESELAKMEDDAREIRETRAAEDRRQRQRILELERAKRNSEFDDRMKERLQYKPR